MNRAEFTERVINDGIAGARADYVELGQKEKLEGSISGFEKCRNKNPLELLAILYDTRRVMHKAIIDKTENYWFIRCEEVAIDWVCSCVSVVLLIEGLNPIVNITTRGVIKAASILGTTENLVGPCDQNVNQDTNLITKQNFFTQLHAIKEEDISTGGNIEYWSYVWEKIEIYFEEQESIECGSWGIFHAAWGYDRGDGNRIRYNKKAWMYVQGKMEIYFCRKS